MAAYVQYLTFDGTALPFPDSYEVDMSDVEADSGGSTALREAHWNGQCDLPPSKARGRFR